MIDWVALLLGIIIGVMIVSGAMTIRNWIIHYKFTRMVGEWQRERDDDGK